MTNVALTTYDLENLDYRSLPWQELNDLITGKQMNAKAYKQFFKTGHISGLMVSACLNPEADIFDIIEMIRNLPKSLLKYEQMYANLVLEILVEQRRSDMDSYMNNEYHIDTQHMPEQMVMQMLGLANYLG
jgi:hypothetical protein